MTSKLGFHIDLYTHPGEIEKIIDCRPKVIKVISNMGALNALSDALGPDTVFIARDWAAGDDYKRFRSGDPERDAHRWFEVMRPSIKQASFAYWEAFNEPQLDKELMREYALFEMHRQEIGMILYGYRSCIGNFSVGAPEIVGDGDLWPYFYPALEAAHNYRSILGLHEYGGMWMDMWYGNNTHLTVLQGLRDPFPETHSSGWLFGRYRMVWNKHLAANGFTDVRIVLNEFGLDRAATVTSEQIAGYATGPWKTCRKAWRDVDKREDAEQFYVEQLQWADRQMQKDPYLTGATIFTWGTPQPDGWVDWDIEGEVADKIVNHIKTEHTAPPAIEPIKLRWPTDYLRVTQKFGDSYNYYWSNFKLPGHEGIDIQAPYGSPIYACADGKVIASYYGGAYGRQIRIEHRDGYQTIYAHLQASNVKVGQQVLAGEIIGKADSTGNSSGSHLHLTLKLKGATARGETRFPNDIIDPTPHLLIPVIPPVTETKVHTTSVSGQFIRSGAGTGYRAIASVYPGNILTTLLSESEVRDLIRAGKWLKVKTAKGTEGWAAAWLLEIL